jgi:Holliday junction DNA helicase RuvA
MIAKIKGIIDEFVDDHHILVEVSGIFYDILLPAIIMKEIRESYVPGDEITLCTLYEIESAGGFGSMTPRLIGFLNSQDKRFFEKLVKVKDFGVKRAMKALIVPFDQVALAIEQADIKFLSTLPEIGKRTAEKIVAELKGKVSEFTSDQETSDILSMDDSKLPDFKRETLLALQQMGYKRHEATQMINHALQRKPDINKTDDLILEVFHKPE